MSGGLMSGGIMSATHAEDTSSSDEDDNRASPTTPTTSATFESAAAAHDDFDEFCLVAPREGDLCYSAVRTSAILRKMRKNSG